MPRIAPQSGTAFRIEKGQGLRVTDIEGEQVSDLVSFSLDDAREWLSSGRSIDYANTIYLTIGHTLYSNRSRPMFTIEEDTVGRHDFLLTPCSPDTFTIIYGYQGHHPSCFENLWRNLARFAIAPDTIPTTFNIFMNVGVGADGELEIKPPRSKPGDHVLLRAEMDMYVGLTACSAEKSNNHSFKPIHYEVLDAA
ncbi:MAG: urea carboxylase-associated family protein [Candidatus Dormibacteraeota bacterium]|nr:urea carboxylase-associated family protein [Candidatus Dormibacteraeota bacterium]